jgi:cytochrome c5
MSSHASHSMTSQRKIACGSVAAVYAAVLLVGCSDDPQPRTASVEQTTVSTVQRTDWNGAKIYDEVCDLCHKMGIDGAPELGDSAAWQARIAKGRDTLLEHLIGGFKKMPPRGDCEFCSDAQLAEALDDLLEQAR